MLDLKKLLAHLLKSDYIIEEKATGIWKYRKWASGVAECWGTRSVYLNLNQTYGPLYYSTFEQALPPGLFTQIDNVQATRAGVGGSGNGLVWTSLHTVNTTKLGVYASDSASQAQTWAFSFYVKGLWKTFTPKG